MPIRKFTRNSADSEHYDYCARHRNPVIVIANLDAEHCALFYDITERDGDITTVSAAVRRIAEAYAELYDLPAHIREHFADQCYYFNLPVRREHAEYAAEALFDYLLRQLRAA